MAGIARAIVALSIALSAIGISRPFSLALDLTFATLAKITGSLPSLLHQMLRIQIELPNRGTPQSGLRRPVR